MKRARRIREERRKEGKGGEKLKGGGNRGGKCSCRCDLTPHFSGNLL